MPKTTAKNRKYREHDLLSGSFDEVIKKALKRDKDVESEDLPPTAAIASEGGPPSPSAGRDTFTQDGITYAEDQLLYLVNEVKDYQLTHASLLKLLEYETDTFSAARGIGISILPTSFPRKSFDDALALQAVYNELYMKVASDPEFLQSVFEPLTQHDPFLRALWDIFVKVRDAGALQDVICGVFRSDYMLHQPTPDVPLELKQVEMNTFSCAGACHAERATNMHRHLSRIRQLAPGATSAPSTTLPQSNNSQAIVEVLKAAHEAYIPSSTSSARTTCVLMTVQPHNFNIADERPIEYGLWEADVPLYRCEWQTVLEHTTLAQDRTLLFRPSFGAGALEVSAVYYRGGYAAVEYREQSWQTRLRLEMSRAIKCPDVLTHLATFKAVQAALCNAGALERFLAPEPAAIVRSTFMPMQILDASPEGMQARGVLTDPAQTERHVLKPNLEGGGHNVYGPRIPDVLADVPQEQWQQFTLMRLIEPPQVTGTLMPPDELHHGDVISELGVLGTCLWRRTGGKVEILRNETAGWTFKTKASDVEEMSVVKGYGCFDCPNLID